MGRYGELDHTKINNFISMQMVFYYDNDYGQFQIHSKACVAFKFNVRSALSSCKSTSNKITDHFSRQGICFSMRKVNRNS